MIHLIGEKMNLSKFLQNVCDIIISRDIEINFQILYFLGVNQPPKMGSKGHISKK